MIDMKDSAEDIARRIKNYIKWERKNFEKLDHSKDINITLSFNRIFRELKNIEDNL